MEPQESVFGSGEEYRCYLKLRATWGDKYEVFHNLPFLTMFRGRETVSDEEYEYLKKTSVDYVICSKGGRPLIGIEFDGMQHGHNVGEEYISGFGQKDRERRRKQLELKLRIAHNARFPFFVLSGSQFKNLPHGLRLSVVDAIIGEVFASEAVGEKFRRGFDPEEYGLSPEEFSRLSEEEQRDMIEDWAIGAEVEADFRNNPIFQKSAELEDTVEMKESSYWFPRHEGYDPNKWTIVESTVTDWQGRTAWTRVCIPNFQSPGCEFTTHIAIEIGRMVCLEELRVQRNRGKHESSEEGGSYGC